MSNWKKLAVVVAVVVIVGVVTTFVVGNWTTIVDNALCAIQSNIGLEHHFHIDDSYACPYN